MHMRQRDSATARQRESAKASLLIENVATNSGDLFARKLGHEVFPFEVSSAPVDI
jgi:hypothetical protein